MTSVFDPQTQQAQRVLDEAAADHGLSVALDHARELGGRSGLRRLAEYQRRISAVEAQIMAGYVQGDGDTRRAQGLLNDGKTSKREQRLKANRAKAVGQNPDLAAKLAAGALSEEQVDVIAAAAAKSDGDAATDTELIDKVAAVPPEQGRGITDEYLADRATADGVQTEHNRQRALRRASTFHSKSKGLATISIEGDSIAVNKMWDEIKRQAELEYKLDGGRDLPLHKHPRTNDHRKFDAAYALLCGTAQPEEEAVNPGTKAAAPTPLKRHTQRAARPRIVINMAVDHFLGKEPAAIATQVGLGLIPDSVLSEYAEHADIMAALFDRSGEPLWLGRMHRHANTTQLIALILRDRGCVQCGTSHTDCQAHHTMPWNAPGKGRTDLDDLVLLCQSCHHELHAAKRTIYRDRTGTWRTRPATPDETPPPRPTATRNQVRRE